MDTIGSYVPQDSEERAHYLMDFLDDMSRDITRLYSFFQSRGFSDVPLETVARHRIKFLGTLSNLRIVEEEYRTLTGDPHSSYSPTTKKLDRLIEQSGNQLDYRRAQIVSLN